ncbi:MAG TPA: PKD domain-containing protein, partial [Candidatus Dormibacteraeota bacterium]|nr:PKD domain-containing protein [Candidatus Dormibacteraeota bacterium]
TGQPTAPILGAAPPVSGYVPCCQLHDFFLSPAPTVTKGVKYAIVAELTIGNLRWLDSGPLRPYTAGTEYIGGSPTSWSTTSDGDFGFQEWVVAGPSNSAPVVTVDSTAVSVPEGTAPANSGTCSDPDGDMVTLSASDGVVSACNAGKYTWSKPAGDEAGMETVTITADDGKGLTAQVPFAFDVTPQDPTATIVSDPPTITVPEGTNVPFTGTGTSPDPADNAAGFKYGWSVSINGAAYASGSGAAFSFVPKDDGSYLVTFNATDDGGMTGTTSMTVIATNVAPNAAITGVAATAPLVTTAFESLNFTGTFTDADNVDKYTMTWSFGDGSFASGLNASHAYSLPGTYTVKFQVTDGEGGVGQATTSVTVQTTQQALSSIEAYVQSLPGLNAGQRNSLMVKLQNAGAAAGRGDDTAASNELNAFLNELQADVNTGKVTQTAAGILRTSVHTVQGSLGTFNRLVEWWPLEA